MKQELALFRAMLRCAKEYNSQNILEWGDTFTYGQQAEQLVAKLTELGYCIDKTTPDSTETSVLTDENGE